VNVIPEALEYIRRGAAALPEGRIDARDIGDSK
jgi:hypothetical protein